MTECKENSLENLKNFVPVRDAAKRVSYTTDYVARLAREGKIDARREGRTWQVDLDSLKLFSLQAKADSLRKQEQLKIERRQEQAAAKIAKAYQVQVVSLNQRQHHAILEATALTVCLSLALLLVQVSLTSGISIKDFKQGVMVVGEETQSAIALKSLIDFDLPDWLWFFRYEKKESVIVVDEVDSIPVNQTTKLTGNTRYPAQVDVDEAELIITTSENVKYTKDIFSDDVLLEFIDSRRGTVTAEFVSGESQSYPFRLVKTPIKPSAD